MCHVTSDLNVTTGIVTRSDRKHAGAGVDKQVEGLINDLPVCSKLEGCEVKVLRYFEAGG